MTRAELTALAESSTGSSTLVCFDKIFLKPAGTSCCRLKIFGETARFELKVNKKIK